MSKVLNLKITNCLDQNDGIHVEFSIDELGCAWENTSEEAFDDLAQAAYFVAHLTSKLT